MRYNTAAQKFVSAVSSAFILFNSIAPYALVLTSQPLPVANVVAQEVTEPTAEPTQESQATPIEETPTTEPTSEPTAEPTSEPTVTPTQENPSTPSENTSTPAEQSSPSSEPTNASVVTPTVQVVPTISDENAHVESTVVESNQCYADSLNGCNASVVTDKEDYAPTEMVLLKGSGFSPHTMYRMVISSSDAPAVTFGTYITTDELGEFSASYQLDGIYRPNYEVNIYNEANELVARTTFTDSHVSTHQCAIDSAGADDEPGQKDLNNMCVDYAGLPTNLTTTWKWDDIAWSGNNTGDACNLFDTDGDGNANYSLCVIISGDPASFQSRVLYSCGDTRPDRCSASVAVATTATCTASVQSPDIFGIRQKDNSNKDTYGQCVIPVSEIGGTTATLLDVCSYPSGQPNSDPSDCIVFRVRSGKLEVKKIVSPTSDTGKFNLQIDGTTRASDVSNGGTTNEIVVDEGNHTVGETAGTATSLSNYSTSIVCKDLNGTGATVASSSNAGPLTVAVADGQDIVCTITNTVNQGQLKVVKNTVGDNGTFDFTVSGPSASTPQITTSGNTGTTGFVSVNTGTYSVTETVPAGWSLTSASCANAAGAPVGTSGATGVSGITVGPNDQITCTFNDTRLRDITACKYNDLTGNGRDQNDPMLAGWEMTLNPGGVKQETGQNGCTTFTGLAPNDYTVSETTQTDWTAITQTSQDVDLTGSQNEAVYFGNFACATITGSKWEDLNGNGVWDQDEPTVANWPINLSGQTDAQTTTDENGDYSFKVCTPGIHVVAEGTLNANEWYQTFPAFEYYDVDVQSGGTYTDNDFGNARYARIYGFKYEDNDGDGQLDANDLLDTLGGWVIELYDGATNTLITTKTTLLNGFYEFTNLFVDKTYFLREQQQAGWTQTYGPTNVTPTPMGVVSGQQTKIDFANFQNIDIAGTKYNDLNGNGSRDQEPGLQGWTIFIDTNDNQTLDQGEVSDTTDANGNYSFTNLGPGTYVVCEVAQSGWTQTSSPTCHTEVAESGQNSQGNDFGNQGRGTLIIKKVLNPTNDASLWDMAVDGEYATASSTLGHNQTSQHVLPDGEYAIVESPDTGVNGDLYDSTYSCVDEQDNTVASGLGRNIDDLSVNTGETVTCTFTNTARGSITIIKDANPNSAQDFSFTATGTGSFSLDDDADNTLSNTQEITGLVNGTYTFTEGAVAGWDLTGLTCSDGQSTVPSTVSLENRVATVNLEPGENVTCTFTNTQRGSISGYKFEDADGDIASTDDLSAVLGWNIDLYSCLSGYVDCTKIGSTTTDANGYYSFSNLVPDLYKVMEELVTGWTHLTSDELNVELVAGESDANNNFTNFENVSVTVCKVIDNDGNIESIDDQTFYGGWPVYLIVDGQVIEDSITTSKDGCYTWEDLEPNHAYGVQEGNVDGYEPLGDTTYPFGQATSGSEYTHTFYNQGRGSITVIKLVDVDGDGETDGEVDEFEGLEWNWSLDADEGHDTGETVNVPAGNHNIEESKFSDYHLTSLTCDTEQYDTDGSYANITVNPGDDITCTYVNTRDTGKVVVTKFHDLNASGYWEGESEESGLEGWTINLGDYTAVTDEFGNVEFTIPTGTYNLSEVIQDGWNQSNIYCLSERDRVLADSENSEEIMVEENDEISCFIGNYQDGEIIVTKYSDDNGNGKWDEGEEALGGWEMNLAQGESLKEQTTDEENGQTTFDDLTPGAYVLSEDQQKGWEQTAITCNVEETNPTVTPTVTPTPTVFEEETLLNSLVGAAHAVEVDQKDDSVNVDVTSGQTVNCEVGNKPLIPELTIAKKNDTGGAPRVPGDIVTFTLTVTVAESSVEDTLVIDVPSEGFQYVGGSWTALKNGLPFIIPEPTYASPGTWSLGDLQIGDEIVLTYQAKVAATQDTGVYPDLAWSEGQSLGGEQVLALAQPEGFVDTNFVGTEVEILADNYINDSLDIRREEKREEGKVLGASTLPATGAATILALAALLMVAAGAGGVAYGLRLKKKKS